MKRNLARLRAYKERIEEREGEVEPVQWPSMPPPLRQIGGWPHPPQDPADIWWDGEDPMPTRYHKYWMDPLQALPPDRVSQSYPIRNVESRIVFGIKDGRSI